MRHHHTPYQRTILSLSVAASFVAGIAAASIADSHTAPHQGYSIMLPVMECDTDADCEAKNPALVDQQPQAARVIRTFQF